MGMTESTKKELLAITSAALAKIAYLGVLSIDRQTLHLSNAVLVSVVLEFPANLQHFCVVYNVFDAQTNQFAEVGYYDKNRISKLKQFKKNGIPKS